MSRKYEDFRRGLDSILAFSSAGKKFEKMRGHAALLLYCISDEGQKSSGILFRLHRGYSCTS
jgi:hypothetical protein